MVAGLARGVRSAAADQSTGSDRETGVALPLGLPDDLDKASALLWAEDRRELDDELLRLTRDRDPAVRGRAALAVGRIGLPAGMPRLLDLTRDPEPEVRALAAFGLGVLELDLEPAMAATTGRRVSEVLVRLIDDPDPRVATLALWALGARANAAATTPVGELLRDSAPRSADVIVAALGAWWRLPGARPGPAAALASSADPDVRLAAAQALRRFTDPGAMPPLVPLLEDPVPLVRATAARGLRDAPRNVADEQLPGLLRDQDWRVVCEALGWAATLWQNGGDVEEETLTGVIRASLSSNRHVKRRAFAALAVVAPDWSVPADRLAQALRDTDAVIRAAALEALGNAGTDAVREVYGEVLEAYEIESPPADASPRVIPERLRNNPIEAAAMAKVLGVSRHEEARAWLELLAEWGPPVARAEALRQWGDLDPSRAAQRARRELTSGPPELRAVAAEVVGLLSARGRLPSLGGDANWTDMLWNAQLAMAAAGALEPRLILLNTLLDVDPATTRRRATALVRDYDRVVRLWALRNAPQLASERPDLAAEAVGPQETGRGRDEYRALAATLIGWQRRSPVAELVTPRGELSVQLEPAWAPLTVAAFVDWIEAGFFDQVTFHRVVPNFVVQAGDPTAIGYGGSRASLRNEETPLPYAAGTVGLALAGRDTGGSQFFIVHSSQPHLDGIYPVIGRVTRGIRFVDRIQPGDRLEVRIER